MSRILLTSGQNNLPVNAKFKTGRQQPISYTSYPEAYESCTHKKKKESFWANKVLKPWAAFTGYTKGAAVGLLKGGLTGGIIFGGFKLVEFAQKNNFLKRIPKAPRFVQIGIPILTGLGVLAVKLFNTSLNVNEKKAQIDHRWQKNPHSD